jgi:hypothetical protein
MANISFFVPLIPQGQNPICWVACVAMITSWKTNATVTIDQFTGGFDPSGSCIPNPATSWSDFEARLRGFGFTPDGANMTFSPDYIVNTLQAHGPFMISIVAADFPFAGRMCNNMGGMHAMVLNGINSDVSPAQVQVTNPWGIVYPALDCDVILGLLQEVANQTDSNGNNLNHNPAAFMP